MKLLFLTEFFPADSDLIFTGGVEARTYYIAKKAQKDFKVAVISSRSAQTPATPVSVITRFWYIWSSFFKALNKNFDLIEGSNVVSYLPAFFAARVKGKPAVAWIPDVLGQNWLEFGLLVGLPGLILEWVSLRLPWDGIIALSHVTKKKLVREGVSPEKITVVHGGVDLKEFSGAKLKKFSRPTLVCVARLVKTKRVKDLIEAFVRISRKDSPPGTGRTVLKDLRLIIVGFGPLETKLKRQAVRLGLSGRVKFLKNLPRKKLITLLTRSHLLCLPSVVEGFGLVTFEAGAVGTPAILADIAINQEVTQKGQGVLFFKPENSKDLAAKIKRLLSDKNLYQQKQREIKKLAQSYSWQKIYAKTRSFYRHFS